MDNLVDKPSLIKGLLREIYILGYDAYFKSENYSGKVKIRFDVDKAGVSTEDTIILEGLPSNITTGTISFKIDGNLLSADLEGGSEYKFPLPKKINVSNERENNRIEKEELLKSPILIELRGPESKKYTEVVNINHHYILLKSLEHTEVFEPNTYVELRGYVSDNHVFFSPGKIITVRKDMTCVSYLVSLVLDSEKQVIEGIERSKRWVNSDRVNEVGYWPNIEGHRFKFDYKDIGYFGFKGTFSDEFKVPSIGSFIVIPSKKVRAKIVWVEGCDFGCDLRINSITELTYWQDYVDEYIGESFSKYSKSIKNQKILNIFLRSGYLRKHKAYIFEGNNVIADLIPNDPKFSVWIQRYGMSSNTKNMIDAHASFTRITDNTWFIQELSSMSSKKGVGREILCDNLTKFYLKNQVGFDLGSKLMGLYDANLTFNQNFWDRTASKDFVNIYETVVLNLMKDEYKGYSPEKTFKIKLPNWESWEHTYTQLSLKINSDLLSAFGISKNSWKSNQLNEELKRTDFILERKVIIFYREDQPIAIGIQFGLPTLSNVTSTTNHFWIIGSDEKVFECLLTNLKQYPQGLNAITGTTEAVFVKSGSLIDKEFYDNDYKRHFRLILINSLSIKDFIDCVRNDENL